MEQLRGLAWGFDNLGLPLSDLATDTALPTQAASGGRGLSPSPADSLRANVDGYVDYIDAFGRTIGGGSTVPVGGIYIRRWSVEPLPTNPNNTLILQVVVTRLRDRGTADTDEGSTRRLRRRSAALDGQDEESSMIGSSPNALRAVATMTDSRWWSC